MFKRSFRSQELSRVDKPMRFKRSARDLAKFSKLHRSLPDYDHPDQEPTARAAIVTVTVGHEGRVFAAHEDVLRLSPFFDAVCGGNVSEQHSRMISLPDEEPEVFSAVLEYLYKGDYSPSLAQQKQGNSWNLENRPHTCNGSQKPGVGHILTDTAPRATVFVYSAGTDILRDTVIYCAADRYGLEELKRLALKKQGLQTGIDVATILRSAQYAYAHTPDTDSRLRAHYLALIIRCRKTFKRSGTMQAEMEAGGSKLFFDLFVAMCNHLDDVIDETNT